MKLTNQQTAAIQNRARNLQLIACAGSGKREVVARRIADLMKPGPEAALPKNIIAFTYTDRAAAELKHRIVEKSRGPMAHFGVRPR